MRIVYVTCSMPFGPVETFLIPEATALVQAGHELVIVPRSPASGLMHQNANALQEVAINTGLLSVRIALAAIQMLLLRPGTIFSIFAILVQSRNPVVFVKNCTVVPKALWLAKTARDLDVQHIHAHWATTTATLAMLASIASGIPWSMTAHRGDIVDNNLLRAKLAHASFVRFISSSGKELASSVISSGLPATTTTIRMGVDIQTKQSTLTCSNSPLVFLCPANLYPVKGHRYLIAAAAILKARNQQFRVEIAGDGELREELVRLAESLDVGDRITFMKQLPHNEILDRLAQRKVDVVVLPSVDLGNGIHEGIPVSLMEAMANEIPVISTSTGGIPELLGGDAGILVPPADPDAIADAMQLLLLNPELRARYAMAGRRRVEDEFAINRVVQRLSEAFTKTAA